MALTAMRLCIERQRQRERRNASSWNFVLDKKTMDECEMKRDDSIPNAEGLNIKPNFIVHGSDGDDEGETE